MTLIGVVWCGELDVLDIVGLMVVDVCLLFKKSLECILEFIFCFL